MVTNLHQLPVEIDWDDKEYYILGSSYHPLQDIIPSLPYHVPVMPIDWETTLVGKRMEHFIQFTGHTNRLGMLKEEFDKLDELSQYETLAYVAGWIDGMEYGKE